MKAKTKLPKSEVIITDAINQVVFKAFVEGKEASAVTVYLNVTEGTLAFNTAVFHEAMKKMTPKVMQQLGQALVDISNATSKYLK